VVDRFLDEFRCGDLAIAGHFGEDVKRAAGNVDVKVVAQAFDDAVAFFLVGIDIRGHIHAGAWCAMDGFECGVLDDAGGADEGVLLELGHLFDDGFRVTARGGIAQAPAGHAVGFGVAFEQNALVGKQFGDGMVCFVAESIVNFVGNDQNVVFFCNFGGDFELFWRQSNAGGVVWGANDEHFGAPRNGGFEALGVEAEVGVRVYGNGHCAAEFGEMLVHDEVGIEEEDFVAGVEGREHGEHDAGGGAGED